MLGRLIIAGALLLAVGTTTANAAIPTCDDPVDLMCYEGRCHGANNGLMCHTEPCAVWATKCIIGG